MNIDIRLSLSFFDHPKTRKLQKRCGIEAVICLQKLWLWAADQRPNGALSGLDAEDIELAADWHGEDGAFVQTLLDCRWLDEEDGVYVLHGWEEHQGYASKSEERSEKARKAVNARWEKQRANTDSIAENTASNTKPILNDTTSINENTASNTPETSINLTPLSLSLRSSDIPPSGEDTCVFLPEKEQQQEKPQAQSRSPYTQEFETFWQAYPKKTGKDAAYRAWQAKKREKRLPELRQLIPKLDAAKRTEQWQRDGGQYIPNPSTWINQARWLDEDVQETPMYEPRRREAPPPEMLRPEITEEQRQKGIARLQALRKKMNAQENAGDAA